MWPLKAGERILLSTTLHGFWRATLVSRLHYMEPLPRSAFPWKSHVGRQGCMRVLLCSYNVKALRVWLESLPIAGSLPPEPLPRVELCGREHTVSQCPIHTNARCFLFFYFSLKAKSRNVSTIWINRSYLHLHLSNAPNNTDNHHSSYKYSKHGRSGHY